MNIPKQSWVASTRWYAALVSAAILQAVVIGVGPHNATAGENTDDGQGTMRYDPIRSRLVPIAPEELKPGRVYIHFSQRLNRRVWSYVQNDGRFWYALGEGTTLQAWRLDIRATQLEQLEKLAEAAPELYRQLQQQARGRVFARLTNDDRWVIAEAARFPTIYNAETGLRWEKHSGDFIPVSSGAWQYQWAVYQGKYVPARHMVPAATGLGIVAPSTSGGCNCR